MAIKVGNNVKNQKATPALYADVFANRPPFGQTGRLFFSTDTGEIFRDTGTSWVLFIGATPIPSGLLPLGTPGQSLKVNATATGLEYFTINSTFIISALGYTPADAANYVPYTGATNNINLGANSYLTASGNFITGSAPQNSTLSPTQLYIINTSGHSGQYTASGYNITDPLNGDFLTYSFANGLSTNYRYRVGTTPTQLGTLSALSLIITNPNGTGQYTPNSFSISDTSWGASFSLSGPVGLVLNDTAFNVQAVYGKTFSRITDNSFNKEVRWNVNEGFYSIDNNNGAYSQIRNGLFDIRTVISGIDRRIYWDTSLGLVLTGRGLTTPYSNFYQNTVPIPVGGLASTNTVQVNNGIMGMLHIHNAGTAQGAVYSILIDSSGVNGNVVLVSNMGLSSVLNVTYIGGGIFQIANTSPFGLNLYYSITINLDI